MKKMGQVSVKWSNAVHAVGVKHTSSWGGQRRWHPGSELWAVLRREGMPAGGMGWAIQTPKCSAGSLIYLYALILQMRKPRPKQLKELVAVMKEVSYRSKWVSVVGVWGAIPWHCLCEVNGWVLFPGDLQGGRGFLEHFTEAREDMGRESGLWH